MGKLSLVERLKEQMIQKGINARELALRAEVGSSFVYDILNGKSKNPTIAKLSAIAKVLDISVPYLLDGRVPYRESIALSPLASSKRTGELVAIPSLALESSTGGEILVTESEKPYYFHRSWIKENLNANAKNLRTIFMHGDNMQPTLSEGDMLLLDISRQAPSPPGLFLIFDGVGLVVNRLEYIGNNKTKGKLRVISDNHKYYSYEKIADEVTIVGRVVWFSRQVI